MHIPASLRRMRNFVVAAIVVVSLLIAAALHNSWLRNDTRSFSNKAIGANVTVTGQQVPADIKAEVTKVPAPATDPRIESLTPIIRVEPSGKLHSTITLRFKLDQKVADDAQVLVAATEKTDDDWKIQTANVLPGGEYITIERDHLCKFWIFRLDIAGFLKDVVQGGIDALTGDLTAKADKPQCQNESKARTEGYGIASSGKTDTLYWCFGIENVGGQDKRVVKIANRMKYPLEISYPGMALVKEDSPEISFKQISKLVSKPGSVVFANGSVTYSVDLQNGSNAKLETMISGMTQTLYTLDIAIDVLVAIVARLGGTSKIGKVAAEGWKFVDELLGDKDCMNAVVEKNIGKMAVECAAAFRSALNLDGIVDALFGVVSTAGAFINWLVSEFNSMIDMISGRDKYTVSVVRNDTAQKYIGTWHTKGQTLTFKEGGTGDVKLDPIPCGGYGREHQCTISIPLKWKLDGVKLVYTFGSSHTVTMENGKPQDFAGDPGRLPTGATFTATLISTGFAKYATSDEYYADNLPNDKLCSAGATSSQKAQCNAG